MSTDSQNPRYSYLTLNRSIVGTDSFELDVAGSTVYRLDTNTSTVNIKFNNSGNDQIPLISKRRIDVGSNGFTKIIVSWTGIAVAETLQLLIADSEASSTDIGVELSDYSTSLTGAITIGGTVDVDIVGQTGADPINVNISSQTGADPLNNNLNQIAGVTTQIPYLQNYLTAFNGEQTDRIQSWTYLVTGQTQIYLTPASFDAYIRTINLSGFQLSASDSTAFLYIGNNVGAITSVLLTFTMNEIDPAISTIKGTNTVSLSFPGAGLKLTTGQTLYLQGATSMWASGTFTGYRVPT